MPLVAEYALTPDVFDVASYTSDEVCGVHLNVIREVMLTEGLVRGLRAGEWRALFASHGRPWHRRAKEVVRKLATQGRLIEVPAALVSAPAGDREWCAEALATHGVRPIAGGVVVTQAVKDSCAADPLVAPIDKLAATPWWTGRSSSVRLVRSLAAYKEHLDQILRCANSILFIDPHLDPGRHRYREFGNLLAHAGRRTPAPLIEIHRVCYEGSGPSRRILALAEIEHVFRDVLSTPLRSAGPNTEVFVWDDFHSRHVISNLIGTLMENGFDTSGGPNSITTWARLGPAHRDDVQREFDPASGCHTLRARFRIP